HLGRRLHRKVIVIDRKTAIVTGLNISNNYNDIRTKKSWLDFAIIVEGAIVAKLYALCLQRWVRKDSRFTIYDLLFKNRNRGAKAIGSENNKSKIKIKNLPFIFVRTIGCGD